MTLHEHSDCEKWSYLIICLENPPGEEEAENVAGETSGLIGLICCHNDTKRKKRWMEGRMLNFCLSHSVWGSGGVRVCCRDEFDSKIKAAAGRNDCQSSIHTNRYQGGVRESQTGQSQFPVIKHDNCSLSLSLCAPVCVCVRLCVNGHKVQSEHNYSQTKHSCDFSEYFLFWMCCTENDLDRHHNLLLKCIFHFHYLSQPKAIYNRTH